MDEVIALENEIRSALIADKVPASVLPWAHDILLHGWTDETGTRLERLQTIVKAIKAQERAT